MSEGGANEGVDELRQLGRKAIAIPANLAHVVDARRAVTTTLNAPGQIDVLVYKLGHHGAGSLP